MFDVGFSELVVIGLVALVVIGPEDLPRVARTVGHMLGKLRRYVADVKSDISREMELADLKRIQEEVQESAAELQNAINDQARALREEFQAAVEPVAAQVRELENTNASSDPPAIHNTIATQFALPDPGSTDPLPEPASDSSAVKASQAAEQDPAQLDLFGNLVANPAPEKKAS